MQRRGSWTSSYEVSKQGLKRAVSELDQGKEAIRVRQ